MKKVATCSDVDTSDSHTFSIENGNDSEYFNISAKSSTLTLVQVINNYTHHKKTTFRRLANDNSGFFFYLNLNST